MSTNIRAATVSAYCLAGLVGLMFVGLAACSGGPDGSLDPLHSASPPAGATASPTFLSMPAWDADDEGQHAPIRAGTYEVPRSAWSVADFTVTFPEDWTVQYGHVYGKNADTEGELGFYAVAVDEIFADACRGEGGPTLHIRPGVNALVAALRDQKGGALKTNVTKTIFGGYPATRLDLTIPKDADLGTCQMAEYGFTGLQVWYSAPADKYFVLLPGAVATVYVVDVDAQRQVFLTQVGSAASAADRAELEAVIDSIDIHAPEAVAATSPQDATNPDDGA